MMTKELIESKTAALATQLGVAAQLEGQKSADKLREIARRFDLIGKSLAAKDCLAMAEMADKYQCA